MLKLPVTTTLPNLKPAVIRKQPQCVTNFHRGQLRRLRGHLPGGFVAVAVVTAAGSAWRCGHRMVMLHLLTFPN